MTSSGLKTEFDYTKLLTFKFLDCALDNGIVDQDDVQTAKTTAVLYTIKLYGDFIERLLPCREELGILFQRIKEAKEMTQCGDDAGGLRFIYPEKGDELEYVWLQIRQIAKFMQEKTAGHDAANMIQKAFDKLEADKTNINELQIDQLINLLNVVMASVETLYKIRSFVASQSK